MKVLYFLSAATLLLSMCSSTGSNDEEGAAGIEELPVPEAQRGGPYRGHSPNRNSYRGGSSDRYRTGGGGGGGGGGGAGYDPSNVYEKMTTNLGLDNHKLDLNTLSSNAYNRAGYAGSSSSSNTRDKYYDKSSSSSSSVGSSSSNSRDDYGYDDQNYKGDQTYKGGDYGYLPSASEYGGHGSESGYGLSCASGYVNASAVALLAFLFLLNIVQDVIQSITNPRRRRDVGEAPSNDVFQFISDGGVDALKEGLPQLMIPLMVELVEASEAPECLQRPLCRVNADLVMEYGVVGRVVGSLFSNVMAKAFTGDHVRHFHLALDAAKLGRNDGDCGAYPACTGPAHKYAPELNKDHVHDSDNVTEEVKESDINEGLEQEVWSSYMELDNKLD